MNAFYAFCGITVTVIIPVQPADLYRELFCRLQITFLTIIVQTLPYLA